MLASKLIEQGQMKACFKKERPSPPSKHKIKQCPDDLIEATQATLDDNADCVKSTKSLISEMTRKLAVLNQSTFNNRTVFPSRSTAAIASANIKESFEMSEVGDNKVETHELKDAKDGIKASDSDICNSKVQTHKLNDANDELSASDSNVKIFKDCKKETTPMCGIDCPESLSIVNPLQLDISVVDNDVIGEVMNPEAPASATFITSAASKIGPSSRAVKDHDQGNILDKAASTESFVSNGTCLYGGSNETDTPAVVTQACDGVPQDEEEDTGPQLHQLSEISPALPSAKCSTESLAVTPSRHPGVINCSSDTHDDISPDNKSQRPTVLSVEPNYGTGTGLANKQLANQRLVNQQQQEAERAASRKHTTTNYSYAIVSEFQNNKTEELRGAETGKEQQTGGLVRTPKNKQVHFQFPGPEYVNNIMDSVEELEKISVTAMDNIGLRSSGSSEPVFKEGHKVGSPVSVDSSYASISDSLSTSAEGSPTLSDRNSGSDNDEDEGVYADTFRYSKYKFAESSSGDELGISNSTLELVTHKQDFTPTNSVDSSGEVVTSLKLTKRRAASAASNFMDSRNDSKQLTMSYKVLNRRHQSCAETYQAVSEKLYEVEKTLILTKLDAGQRGYGFHLLENRPIVVSTVKPGSIADRSGMLIGDRLVTVNKTNVLFADLATVLELAAQYDTHVELGLAAGRLCRDYFLCSGYLCKQEGFMRSWRMRWCALKDDNFLYFYKHEADQDPLGAICLRNYVVMRTIDGRKRCSFRLEKYGEKTIYLQAETEEDMNKWATAINSMNTSVSSDIWLNISSHNIGLPALSIKNPDCHGFLTKVGNRKKTWRKRYCVLKTACLYYYLDQSSITAKGAAHLHGYTLEEDIPYNRKFGFSMVPPVAEMRTFYFYADNETDFKRWVYAMKISVGKWIKVDNKSLSPLTVNFD